jgi:hypothetical protein
MDALVERLSSADPFALCAIPFAGGNTCIHAFLVWVWVHRRIRTSVIIMNVMLYTISNTHFLLVSLVLLHLSSRLHCVLLLSTSINRYPFRLYQHHQPPQLPMLFFTSTFDITLLPHSSISNCSASDSRNPPLPSTLSDDVSLTLPYQYPYVTHTND